MNIGMLDRLLCASVIVCFVMQGSEQQITLLNPVIIHIASHHNERVTPDPVRLAQILTTAVSDLPQDVRKIILTYARWEQDEKSYQEDRELRHALQECRKAQWISAAAFIGGVSELAVCFIKATTDNPATLQVTGSWEVPVVSTIFTCSMIATCWDCCRHLRRRETYEVGKWASRLLGSIVAASVPLSVLVGVVGGNALQVGAGLVPGATWGTFFSPNILIHSIRKQYRLQQIWELKQHLREKLYIQK